MSSIITTVRYVVGILLLGLFSKSVSGADYTIIVDKSNPLVARASFWLPPSNGELRTLILRGVDWGRESQVSDVRCKHGLLKSQTQGEWEVPSDCESVSWKIHFKDSSEYAESLYFASGGWWLVSETTSILRLKDSSQTFSLTFDPLPEQMLSIGEIPGKNEGSWLVPSAPAFFVVGNINPTEVEVEGFNITYVADDTKRVFQKSLQFAHRSALRYLLTLFNKSERALSSKPSLLVVWVGVPAAQHRIGGIAGSRSFIANYVYGEEDEKDKYRAMDLTVIAHEQFHQLVDMNIEGGSRPIWANESLAHYYGLKALEKSGLPKQSVSLAQSRFIDADKLVEAGLIELEERYNSGDMSAYPMFYSQGATFWSQIDLTISESTKGNQSLDGMLLELLKSDFEKSRMLPNSFLTHLREKGGARIDTLVERYINARFDNEGHD